MCLSCVLWTGQILAGIALQFSFWLAFGDLDTVPIPIQKVGFVPEKDQFLILFLQENVQEESEMKPGLSIPFLCTSAVPQHRQHRDVQHQRHPQQRAQSRFPVARRHGAVPRYQGRRHDEQSSVRQPIRDKGRGNRKYERRHGHRGVGGGRGGSGTMAERVGGTGAVHSGV